MKFKLITLIGLLVVTLSYSQKVIEKNISYNNQSIQVDVPFASDIEVKTWDKQTIYFKADITTEGGKYLDEYQLKIEEGNTVISIESNPKEVFQKFQDEHRAKTPKEEGKKYYGYNMEYTFNYVLYVPKNSKFSIKSINGHLAADVIEGTFKADLINGNISIKKYKGDLELSTINGEIDLKMENTKMVSETINGQIYADESMKLKTYDKYVGQKVEGSFGNANNSLKLNTINGYIYLRS